MSQNLFIREMPNGITLLGQPMEGVSSAAMTIVVPVGAAHDPQGMEGAAAILVQWMMRGAAGQTSRQLNDALDALGSERGENVISEHLQFSTVQLGTNLREVLEIYADILRRPNFDDDPFEPCRELTSADLESLEDEPARKCNNLLRERFYPWPMGRNIFGNACSLANITPGALREHAQKSLTPHGVIISVAGQVDWPAFCEHADELLGDWAGPKPQPLVLKPPAKDTLFVQKDTSQVYIALAHEAPPAGHAQHYAARLAESVLSGGMSSRLMTELRDKRGLVYNVSSRYSAIRNFAGLFTTAGTTPQRAQQTLEVMVEELTRIAKGVTEEELARSRAQLKSSLIMQGESTSSRSSVLCSDWLHLRRLRTLAELSNAIDAITPDDVLQYARHWPARQFTMVQIGPEPLQTECMY